MTDEHDFKTFAPSSGPDINIFVHTCMCVLCLL